LPELEPGDASGWLTAASTPSTFAKWSSPSSCAQLVIAATVMKEASLIPFHPG
jgi:hypothetical protein